MFPYVLLTVAALAGATESSSPVKLAQPELRGANVERASLDFFGENLAARLRSAGFTVITQREIETLLGFERQKQMLGCDENSSCMAELANALGTDGVVVGTVGHFGATWQIELKVLSGADARVLGSVSEKAASEEEVLEVLGRAAPSLSKQVHEALGRTVPESALIEPGGIERQPTVRSRAWIPLAFGGAFAIAGGVLLGLAGSDYQALVGPGSALGNGEGEALAASGSLKRTLGITGVAIGGAAILAGVLMAALGGPSTPALSFGPAPRGEGAMVMWSGALP